MISSLVSGLVACTADEGTEVDSPSELGAFGVGYLTFTAVDSERDDRSLVVDIWYPADPSGSADAEPASYLLSVCSRRRSSRSPGPVP